MFKIDKNRKIVLENGLIEVVRFPRGWKVGSEVLWNLTLDQQIQLARVMKPGFEDARIYKSEKVGEAHPDVIELPRYYAIGINKNDNWYTEEGLLTAGALPSHIIERAKQKLPGYSIAEAFRSGWFIVLVSSLFLTVMTLTIMLMTGNFVPQVTGFGGLWLAIATIWAKIGLPYCVVMFALKTFFLYCKRWALEEAFKKVEAPQANLTQPLPSSAEVL